MVIYVKGSWDAGVVFDRHMIESVHLGVNELGYNKFQNTRSEIGELVYQLKYRGDKAAAKKIATLLDGVQNVEKYDLITPIPPTNKARPYQPVFEIAKELGARRNVTVIEDLLSNSGDQQIKNVTDPIERRELLTKAFGIKAHPSIKGKKVIILDDLFDSGDTLEVAAKLVRAAGAEHIAVLAMTKTRSSG